MPHDRHDDRRRHARRAWCAPGFVYAQGRVTAVELQDISRELDVIDAGLGGVGFLSPAPYEAGSEVRLRVGLGPLKAPRRATIAYSRRRPDGRWWVGARLHGAEAESEAA